MSPANPASRDPARPDIAIAVEAKGWPGPETLLRLAEAVVEAVLLEKPDAGVQPGSELSLVFSDDAHVAELNASWRGKNAPTNVLSFPAPPMPGGGAPALGDVVLAVETVRREAEAEGKPFDHHLAHLLVHGVLHLLGADHEDEAEAEEMEALERRALARLAIPDPYL